MKKNTQKKWEELLWTYHSKIMPDKDDDFKTFEFYLYLTTDPLNNKYKEAFNVS